MKKIMIILFTILMISGCSNTKLKNVTCSMDDSIKQAGVKVIYTYDKDNKVTKIKTDSYFAFTKEELKKVSLDNYYEEIKTMYAEIKNEDGVKMKIKKDEKKNRVIMSIDLDTEYYDTDEDILNVCVEGDFNDVTSFIEMKEALGVYQCGKVK